MKLFLILKAMALFLNQLAFGLLVQGTHLQMSVLLSTHLRMDKHKTN